jgi:hypothetical protein
MIHGSYSYGASAVEDADSHLHPETTRDSAKFCMYKAMAAANGEPWSLYTKYVEATKPLRRIFFVPFDDDVWGVMLAYLYDFHYKGLYSSYATFETGLKSEAGQAYYVSILSSSSEKSGHAICVKSTKDKVLEFIDNENSNTEAIASKFKATCFSFLVFKKVGGVGGSSAHAMAYHIANMPKAMIETMLIAKGGYSTKKIEGRSPEDIRTDDQAREMLAKLQKQPSLIKAASHIGGGASSTISGFDSAMPKT